MGKNNLFADIPENITEEIFDTLIKSEHVKIERIVSKGQKSPENFWYDQDQNEWVIVLKGSASISFENGNITELQQGDYIKIPAHKKHRVEKTDQITETIWLAVFY